MHLHRLSIVSEYNHKVLMDEAHDWASLSLEETQTVSFSCDCMTSLRHKHEQQQQQQRVDPDSHVEILVESANRGVETICSLVLWFRHYNFFFFTRIHFQVSASAL